MWRVEAQANESLCVESKMEKEVAQVMGFGKVDEQKLGSRKRVTFAPNLVSDVFG